MQAPVARHLWTGLRLIFTPANNRIQIFNMQIQTTVAGIPCIAALASDEDGGFELLDRRNRPAPWLERKLTQQDSTRIREEIEQAEREGYFL